MTWTSFRSRHSRWISKSSPSEPSGVSRLAVCMSFNVAIADFWLIRDRNREVAVVEVVVVGVAVVAVEDPGVVGVVPARGPDVATAIRFMFFLLSCS